MSPARDTLAHRKYEQIQPDRAAQHEEILQKLAERGDHGGADQLKRNRLEFEASDAVALGADPATALVGHCANNLLETLHRAGYDELTLASVCIGSTLQDDVSAEMRRFPDGSGLILVSDSILTLTGLLSSFVGELFARVGSGPAVITAWRSLKMAVTKKLPVSTDPLVALLRYHNIHQRVGGTAAKLGLELDSDPAGIGMLVSLIATKFVIAHELAHHVLGHSAPVSSFSALADLPACSPDQQLELDADKLALEILLNSTEKHLDGSDLDLPPALLLTAALVSIVTVHAAERAMFIRRGSTHPPAQVRAAALLSQFPPSDQQFSELWLHQVVAATDSAAAFNPAATSIDLNSIYSNPRIDSPLDRSYLQAVHTYDKVQCTEASVLVGNFPELDELQGTRLSPGGELALAGRPAEALAAWGVSAATTTQILETNRSLSFHSLLNSVRSGLKSQTDLDADTATMFALAAATAVAPHLEGRTHQ
ncbi:hypothetical protein AB0H36_11635 [Kribbella sp. NPDC050820]|uniref:hypothetical protein n=1 Tax=Kribbella sp. NPDC050820 TaxID=3155408 RepID=UPI0033FB193B